MNIRLISYDPELHELEISYSIPIDEFVSDCKTDFVEDDNLDSILEGEPLCDCDVCAELVKMKEEVRAFMVKALL